MGHVREVRSDVDLPDGVRGVQVLARDQPRRPLRHQVQDMGEERCYGSGKGGHLQITLSYASILFLTLRIVLC